MAKHPSLIGLREAGRRLNKSTSQVQSLIRAGLLPASQLGGSRVWLIEAADVTRLQGSRQLRYVKRKAS